LQKEVLFSQGFEAPTFERVIAQVGYSSFCFALCAPELMSPQSSGTTLGSLQWISLIGALLRKPKCRLDRGLFMAAGKWRVELIEH
jgi:hypothetical protein